MNAIAPVAIDTPMLLRDLTGMNVAEAERYWSASPTRARWGAPGDPRRSADTVVFLVSGAASSITGTTIAADGGYLVGEEVLVALGRPAEPRSPR